MSNRGIRIRGVILIVLGSALAIGMVWLLKDIGGAMQPGGSPSGTRFTGSEDQGRLINGVLTAILAMAVVFGLYGVFMAVTGKESRVMKIAAWIIWLLLIGAALGTGWSARGGFPSLF